MLCDTETIAESCLKEHDVGAPGRIVHDTSEGMSVEGDHSARAPNLLTTDVGI